MVKLKLFSILVIINVGLSLAFPQNNQPAPNQPNPNQPISVLPNNAIPHSGIVGGFDTLAAGIANFGNGVGSALDAIAGGIFTGSANLFSGIFGSGAVSSAFLNYNNRLPVEAA